MIQGPRRTAYSAGTSSDPSQTALTASHVSSSIDVTPGTVASRVQIIQNAQVMAPSSPPLRQPRSSAELGRPATPHTSFGRRISGRFGKPALYNSNPSEEAHIRARHSYLGLRTIRKNLEQDHATTTKAEQTVGSHDQIQQRGMAIEVPGSSLSTMPVQDSGLGNDFVERGDVQGVDGASQSQFTSMPRIIRFLFMLCAHRGVIKQFAFPVCYLLFTNIHRRSLSGADI
jgi:hypothetical protein